MRRAWRIAGIFCALISVAAWLAFGANRGWTKTTRTRMEKDPVTEIEFPNVEKKFSPGVELLALGLLLSTAIIGVSFFVRQKQTDSQI
jgi:hypothetical protein